MDNSTKSHSGKEVQGVINKGKWTFKCCARNSRAIDKQIMHASETCGSSQLQRPQDRFLLSLANLKALI